MSVQKIYDWPVDDFTDFARRYVMTRLRGRMLTTDFKEDVIQEFTLACLMAEHRLKSMRNVNFALMYRKLWERFIPLYSRYYQRHQQAHFSGFRRERDATDYHLHMATREQLFDFFSENCTDTYGMRSTAERELKRYRVIINQRFECIMNGREIEQCLLLKKSARNEALHRPTIRVLYEGQVYRSRYELVKQKFMTAREFRAGKTLGMELEISLVEIVK